MGCATSVVKYLIFFFNLLFALAGLAFLAVGVLFKLSLDDYAKAINSEQKGLSLAPTLLIVIGAVVFIIAFFGCCGAIRESTCMLTTYAIILLVILILQVALGVYAFLQFKDDQSGFKDEIFKEIRRSMDVYNTDNLARESLDSLQYNLKCCGAKGPREWENIWNNGTVPNSCCPNRPHDCRYGAAFDTGCGEKLWDFLKHSVKIIAIVVIVIAAVELIGAIVALCLASSIRNGHRRGTYA